jgi:hypothetical protein
MIEPSRLLLYKQLENIFYKIIQITADSQKTTKVKHSASWTINPAKGTHDMQNT